MGSRRIRSTASHAPAACGGWESIVSSGGCRAADAGWRAAGATLLLAIALAAHTGVASADWQNYKAAQDGLADNQVLAILEAADGSMWFGTPNGASRFDGSRWITIRDSLVNLAVGALCQERSGAMWFGTQNGGASRFDGTRWSHVGNPGMLPSNQVEAILEDERLETLVRRLAATKAGAREIALAIVDDVRVFCHGELGADDVTIVVVRRK